MRKEGTAASTSSWAYFGEMSMWLELWPAMAMPRMPTPIVMNVTLIARPEEPEPGTYPVSRRNIAVRTNAEQDAVFRTATVDMICAAA